MCGMVTQNIHTVCRLNQRLTLQQPPTYHPQFSDLKDQHNPCNRPTDRTTISSARLHPMIG